MADNVPAPTTDAQKIATYAKRIQEYKNAYVKEIYSVDNKGNFVPKTVSSDKEVGGLLFDDSNLVKKPTYEEVFLDDNYNNFVYNGTNTAVYINGILVNDLFSIRWIATQGDAPLYNYNNRFFNNIAQGNFTVTGELVINFKRTAYLYEIIKESRKQNDDGNYGINLMRDAVENTRFKSRWDQQPANKNKVLDAKRKELRDQLWGTQNADKHSILTALQEQAKQFFDIFIIYGNPNAKDGAGNPTYQMHTITDVKILSIQQAFQADATPIQEVYTFVARHFDKPLNRGAQSYKSVAVPRTESVSERDVYRAIETLAQKTGEELYNFMTNDRSIISNIEIRESDGQIGIAGAGGIIKTGGYYVNASAYLPFQDNDQNYYIDGYKVSPEDIELSNAARSIVLDSLYTRYKGGTNEGKYRPNYYVNPHFIAENLFILGAVDPEDESFVGSFNNPNVNLNRQYRHGERHDITNAMLNVERMVSYVKDNYPISNGDIASLGVLGINGEQPYNRVLKTDDDNYDIMPVLMDPAMDVQTFLTKSFTHTLKVQPDSPLPSYEKLSLVDPLGRKMIIDQNKSVTSPDGAGTGEADIEEALQQFLPFSELKTFDITVSKKEVEDTQGQLIFTTHVGDYLLDLEARGKIPGLPPDYDSIFLSFGDVINGFVYMDSLTIYNEDGTVAIRKPKTKLNTLPTVRGSDYLTTTLDLKIDLYEVFTAKGEFEIGTYFPTDEDTPVKITLELNMIRFAGPKAVVTIPQEADSNFDNNTDPDYMAPASVGAFVRDKYVTISPISGLEKTEYVPRIVAYIGGVQIKYDMQPIIDRCVDVIARTLKKSKDFVGKTVTTLDKDLTNPDQEEKQDKVNIAKLFDKNKRVDFINYIIQEFDRGFSRKKAETLIGNLRVTYDEVKSEKAVVITKFNNIPSISVLNDYLKFDFANVNQVQSSTEALGELYQLPILEEQAEIDQATAKEIQNDARREFNDDVYYIDPTVIGNPNNGLVVFGKSRTKEHTADLVYFSPLGPRFTSVQSLSYLCDNEVYGFKSGGFVALDYEMVYLDTSVNEVDENLLIHLGEKFSTIGVSSSDIVQNLNPIVGGAGAEGGHGSDPIGIDQIWQKASNVIVGLDGNRKQTVEEVADLVQCFRDYIVFSEFLFGFTEENKSLEIRKSRRYNVLVYSTDKIYDHIPIFDYTRNVLRYLTNNVEITTDGSDFKYTASNKTITENHDLLQFGFKELCNKDINAIGGTALAIEDDIILGDTQRLSVEDDTDRRVYKNKVPKIFETVMEYMHYNATKHVFAGGDDPEKFSEVNLVEARGTIDLTSRNIFGRYYAEEVDIDVTFGQLDIDALYAAADDGRIQFKYNGYAVIRRETHDRLWMLLTSRDPDAQLPVGAWEFDEYSSPNDEPDEPLHRDMQFYQAERSDPYGLLVKVPEGSSIEFVVYKAEPIKEYMFALGKEFQQLQKIQSKDDPDKQFDPDDLSFNALSISQGDPGTVFDVFNVNIPKDKEVYTAHIKALSPVYDEDNYKNFFTPVHKGNKDKRTENGYDITKENIIFMNEDNDEVDYLKVNNILEFEDEERYKDIINLLDDLYFDKLNFNYPIFFDNLATYTGIHNNRNGDIELDIFGGDARARYDSHLGNVDYGVFENATWRMVEDGYRREYDGLSVAANGYMLGLGVYDNERIVAILKHSVNSEGDNYDDLKDDSSLKESAVIVTASESSYTFHYFYRIMEANPIIYEEFDINKAYNIGDIVVEDKSVPEEDYAYYEAISQNDNIGYEPSQSIASGEWENTDWIAAKFDTFVQEDQGTGSLWYIDEWDRHLDYKLGEKVIYGDQVFDSQAEVNTSRPTDEGSFWYPIGEVGNEWDSETSYREHTVVYQVADAIVTRNDDVQFKGFYSGSTTYSGLNVVEYNGTFYKLNPRNINVEPGILQEGYAFWEYLGIWKVWREPAKESPILGYAVGDEVYSEGRIYRNSVENNTNAPFITGSLVTGNGWSDIGPQVVGTIGRVIKWSNTTNYTPGAGASSSTVYVDAENDQVRVYKVKMPDTTELSITGHEPISTSPFWETLAENPYGEVTVKRYSFYRANPVPNQGKIPSLEMNAPYWKSVDAPLFPPLAVTDDSGFQFHEKMSILKDQSLNIIQTMIQDNVATWLRLKENETIFEEPEEGSTKYDVFIRLKEGSLESINPNYATEKSEDVNPPSLFKYTDMVQSMFSGILGIGKEGTPFENGEFVLPSGSSTEITETLAYIYNSIKELRKNIPPFKENLDNSTTLIKGKMDNIISDLVDQIAGSPSESYLSARDRMYGLDEALHLGRDKEEVYDPNTFLKTDGFEPNLIGTTDDGTEMGLRVNSLRISERRIECARGMGLTYLYPGEGNVPMLFMDVLEEGASHISNQMIKALNTRYLGINGEYLGFENVDGQEEIPFGYEHSPETKFQYNKMYDGTFLRPFGIPGTLVFSERQLTDEQQAEVDAGADPAQFVGSTPDAISTSYEVDNEKIKGIISDIVLGINEISVFVQNILGIENFEKIAKNIKFSVIEPQGVHPGDKPIPFTLMNGLSSLSDPLGEDEKKVNDAFVDLPYFVILPPEYDAEYENMMLRPIDLDGMIFKNGDKYYVDFSLRTDNADTDLNYKYTKMIGDVTMGLNDYLKYAVYHNYYYSQILKPRSTKDEFVSPTDVEDLTKLIDKEVNKEFGFFQERDDDTFGTYSNVDMMHFRKDFNVGEFSNDYGKEGYLEALCDRVMLAQYVLNNMQHRLLGDPNEDSVSDIRNKVEEHLKLRNSRSFSLYSGKQDGVGSRYLFGLETTDNMLHLPYVITGQIGYEYQSKQYTLPNGIDINYFKRKLQEDKSVLFKQAILYCIINLGKIIQENPKQLRFLDSVEDKYKTFSGNEYEYEVKKMEGLPINKPIEGLGDHFLRVGFNLDI